MNLSLRCSPRPRATGPSRVSVWRFDYQCRGVEGVGKDFRASSGRCVEVVALDVEYVTYRDEQGEQSFSPAQVCVVDREYKVLYKSFCRPVLPEKCKICSGGWRLNIAGIPSFSEVRSTLVNVLSGKRVVGIGLKKDLAALNLDIPEGLQYDIMTFAKFQNQAGNVRSLKRLAREHLHKDIQTKGRAHDAEEDAVTTMQLYMEVVQPGTAESYDDMVERYTQLFMSRLRQ